LHITDSDSVFSRLSSTTSASAALPSSTLVQRPLI